jgi:hypothetical protein
MKFLATLTLVCLSFITHAQDIHFKLAGAVKKKWIGSTIYITASDENFSNLTFYKNHTVVEENRKYKTKKPASSWSITNGDYINDPEIIVQIGNRNYHAEFSTTNNGKEFMTLTWEPERENEDVVIKTFYAE